MSKKSKLRPFNLRGYVYFVVDYVAARFLQASRAIVSLVQQYVTPEFKPFYDEIHIDMPTTVLPCQCRALHGK